MPSRAIGTLDARILALLPTDGTPVLNRVMRAMLSRACERTIAADEYFAARDRLLGKRRIGRLRGQGGQVSCPPNRPRSRRRKRSRPSLSPKPGLKPS